MRSGRSKHRLRAAGALECGQLAATLIRELVRGLASQATEYVLRPASWSRSAGNAVASPGTPGRFADFHGRCGILRPTCSREHHPHETKGHSGFVRKPTQPRASHRVVAAV